MDFETCAEFYEDFPSFVTPEYNIDELEEMLRSTDENLSSGLGYSFQLEPGSSFQTFPSPPASSSTSGSENIKSECDSPTDFNPDDFINFLSDEDADGKSIKSENRSTPSPTNSSSSGSTVSQDPGMTVDTPPISPPSSVFQLPANILPFGANPTQIKLLQGTLIPVQTMPLAALPVQNFRTPLKISPKPVDATNSASKPKTIVLSSKDFKALMLKIQSGKGNGATMPKIIMKSATEAAVQHKKTPVLPKVMPISSSIKPESKPIRSLGVFKGIVDERHLKKQQRMIKNRESASLSRKKKKEYVVSLETRINDLEKENTTLKGENTTLRSQLIAFAQTCQCNHNKLSEFISNKFNSNIIGNNSSSSSSFKSRLLSSNMKKNTAVLLAMVFMVSINFGSFQTYLSHDDGLQSSAMDVDVGFHPAVGRRGLLWVDETGEWNISNSKHSINLDVNQTESDDKCPVSINQTENLRLASELRKWIGVNDFLNLSTVKEKPIGFKLTPDFFELKSVSLPVTSNVKQGYKRNRKNIFNRQLLRNKRIQEPPKNSLQLFGPQIDYEYLRLFEGIKRRDDTFYVLSFNSEHILLPAAAYNKSTRPRMSLMLPAGDPSINGDITLMQIDCEVVNTTEVNLKLEMIPSNLRPKFNINTPSSRDILNKTGGGPVQRTARNIVDSTFESKDKPSQFYRPYFMTPFAAERHRKHENNSRHHNEKPQATTSDTMASIRRRIRGGVNFTFQQESRYFLP